MNGKKGKFVKVRVTEAEHEEIKQRADAEGTGISSLLRDAALAQLYPDRPGDDPVIKQMGMDVEDLWKTVIRSNEMLEQILRIVQELLALRDPQAAARLVANNRSITRS